MMEDNSKLLCLIRHGQGKHNARPDPRFLWHLTHGSDPELTDLGARQAKALRKTLDPSCNYHELSQSVSQPLRNAIAFDAVVVSPLSRTIQTCAHIFGDQAVPKVICALMTERCCSRADVGTPKSGLASRRPECSGWAGLDHLEEQWWPTRTLSPSEFWPVERVGRFKAWLHARPERCLALVGHKGFFQCLTASPSMPKGHSLGNCDTVWVRLLPDGTIVAS